MKYLIPLLFLLSVGLNCAYVTGCCSFHIKTDDACGDHSVTSTDSNEAEERLRRVAGKLNLFVPSDAKAEKIEDILVSALSKPKDFDKGKLSEDVLKDLRKDARAHSAEDDFEALCDFINSANGKKYIILEP